MNNTEKSDLILLLSSIIICFIAGVSVILRNSQYSWNGRMAYIAGGALPLCFIITTITALVQGGRIKEAREEENKQMVTFRISATVIFGVIPAIILIYLIYYYVSTECNNGYTTF